MLAAGVRVAVGTDSRASTPDLRVLQELKQTSKMHPQAPPEAILKLGTLSAAEALGIDRDYGSITVGKRAAFAVVPLSDNSRSPIESILSSAASSSPLNA
jgi:cytosine/adenosine deaminase-related metal-dependent hydrolase